MQEKAEGETPGATRRRFLYEKGLRKKAPGRAEMPLRFCRLTALALVLPRFSRSGGCAAVVPWRDVNYCGAAELHRSSIYWTASVSETGGPRFASTDCTRTDRTDENAGRRLARAHADPRGRRFEQRACAAAAFRLPF